MEPFVERMVKESEELSAKMEKLKVFLFESEKVRGLSAFEHSLLLRQYNAMDEYRYVLNLRIGLHHKQC